MLQIVLTIKHKSFWCFSCEKASIPIPRPLHRNCPVKVEGSFKYPRASGEDTYQATLFPALCLLRGQCTEDECPLVPFSTPTGSIKAFYNRCFISQNTMASEKWLLKKIPEQYTFASRGNTPSADGTKKKKKFK